MAYFDVTGGLTQGPLQAKKLKVGPIEVDDVGDITGVVTINGSPVGAGIGPQNVDVIVTGLGAVAPFIGTLSNIVAKAFAGAKVLLFDGVSGADGAGVLWDSVNRVLSQRVYATVNPTQNFGDVRVEEASATIMARVANITAASVTAGPANVDLFSSAGNIILTAPASQISMTAGTNINILSTGSNITLNAPALGQAVYLNGNNISLQGVADVTVGCQTDINVSSAVGDVNINALEVGKQALVNADSITLLATQGITLNAQTNDLQMSSTTAARMASNNNQVICDNTGLILVGAGGFNLFVPVVSTGVYTWPASIPIGVGPFTLQCTAGGVLSWV